LALAYCVNEPRGTRDIDINVFIAPERVDAVFDVLPGEIEADADDVRLVLRDGQVRLWWRDTPVDLFFSYDPFHERAAERVRVVPLSGTEIPVLTCTDLAVFKAFFSRTKDWADIEEMARAHSLNIPELRVFIRASFGDDSDRLERLDAAIQLGEG
jgi:hypothetical protein